MALMWAVRHVEAWSEYGRRVMPQAYDSLYLADDAELQALQDPSVARMASGSRANYAAGWPALLTSHPAVRPEIKP